MNERVMAFRVGVVVLAASGLAALLIVFFGAGQSLIRGTYTIHLRFPQAPSVAAETPITKNGVLIGRIKHVELFDDHVELTASIDNNRKIRHSEIARIKKSNLFGDAEVEFVPTSAGTAGGAADAFVQHGDYLADGIVATDPIQLLSNMEGDLKKAIASITKASDGVASLTTTLNGVFGNNDQQIKRIMEEAESALTAFNRTMGSVDELIGDPQFKEDMKRTLASLPNLFEQVQLTLSAAQSAVKQFEEVGARAERNLENLEGFTRPLGEQGDQLVADIARVLQSVDNMASQLAVFSEALNSPNGTLGKLLHDDELYNDAREVVERIKQSSRQIEPIMRDLRIASDKIARDPGGELIKRPLLNRTPTGARPKNPHGIPFSSSPHWQEDTGSSLWQR